MKSLLIAFLAWGLVSPLSHGTPGQSVMIDELLLGEDEESFAVLRTERDNLGSYYKSRTKVFLDERSKATGKSVKEVLLTDSTSTVDAEHADPNTEPKVKTEIHQKDERVLLGELLTRFTLIPEPQTGLARRTAESSPFMGMTVHPEGGIQNGQGLVVFDAKTLSEGVFGGRGADLPVQIQSMRQWGTAIYLKLSKDDEDLGEMESHWVCVPPAKAVQVRAHESMEPIYLVAGSFDSKAKAIEAAEKWLATAREKKVAAFSPEIWSMEKNRTLKYLVVQQRSGDVIGTDQKLGIEKALGIRFEPVKSEGFREWVRVPSMY
jgi:hypothetical protein